MSTIKARKLETQNSNKDPSSLRTDNAKLNSQSKQHHTPLLS